MYNIRDYFEFPFNSKKFDYKSVEQFVFFRTALMYLFCTKI